MEELLQEELKKLSQSKDRIQKQQTAARILEIMVDFRVVLADLEQEYYKIFKGAHEMEGTKSGAELMVKELPQYKKYKKAKMLYELAQNSLPVLQMYTKED